MIEELAAHILGVDVDERWEDVDWLSDTAPNEFKESHITHWMPLPAPPVEVE